MKNYIEVSSVDFWRVIHNIPKAVRNFDRQRNVETFTDASSKTVVGKVKRFRRSHQYCLHHSYMKTMHELRKLSGLEHLVLQLDRAEVLHVAT